MIEAEAQTTPLSLFERENLIIDVLDELFGLGPLEALLKDPTSRTSSSTATTRSTSSATASSRKPPSSSRTTGT